MKKKAKPSKLNSLLSQWPKGTVAAQEWLYSLNIPRQLVEGYRRSGWVQRIGRGAYARSGEKIDWLGGVYALQKYLHLPVHVGAKTALELQGYAHFLPLGKGANVHLFGPPIQRLPIWFLRYNWESKVQFHASSLFLGKPDAGLTEKTIGEYSVRLSAPERAALEVASLVPQKETFEGAKLLLDGLATLRPELVQELLEACRSIKAKRLFLYLAEECEHPWVQKLDLDKVNLGSGKRSVIAGGHLNVKYQITVPEVSRVEKGV
ncbi:MAG: type IV toxin-antitoxin system AbiEi family antitoxin [Elusimicrobia bacterium]|nr:type IV toxin-antitoxin system AbiEi family antitoxin [Elusimicrobiota bacterium]